MEDLVAQTLTLGYLIAQLDALHECVVIDHFLKVIKTTTYADPQLISLKLEVLNLCSENKFVLTNLEAGNETAKCFFDS